MKYKKGFYWVTAISEGDVWYPIYIRVEDFILDGKSKNLAELKDLIVKQAVMPEDEQKLQSKIKELEQQLADKQKENKQSLEAILRIINKQLTGLDTFNPPSGVSDAK